MTPSADRARAIWSTLAAILLKTWSCAVPGCVIASGCGSSTRAVRIGRKRDMRVAPCVGRCYVALGLVPRLLSIGVLCLVVATECRATDKFWGNTLGGTFSTPANWQGGSVPGTADIAHFGLSTSTQLTYAVDFSANTTN